MQRRKVAVEEIFEERFEKLPEAFFWSPGRVNIVGEHSDYHDGFVMPSAINLGMTWAAAKNNDDKIRAYTEKFDEVGCFDINEKERTNFEWMLYLQGVTESLKQRGLKFGGVDLVIHSTIPIGSGLSSSSSLATGLTFILSEMYGLKLSRVEIAKIACDAEWWYGTTGGIMDQFCIANGKAGHAVLLDSRSLEFELIDIPKEIEIVVFETTIRHKQIDSPFALRREQAHAVVEIAQDYFKDKKIEKLRDMTAEMLDEIKPEIVKKFGRKDGEMYYRRSKHPITENVRVLEMKDAFSKKDFAKIGQILDECHESLKNDYEVSCRELDSAVSVAKKLPAFIGARMIGGGFGGCTINLVKRGAAKKFAGKLEEKFRKSTGIKGNSYICKPSDGVRKLSFPS